MRAKRAQGKCFNCDEKWSVTHRCGGKALLMLAEDEEEEEDNEANKEDEELILGDVSSLNSLSGTGTLRSLRMWGRIENQLVHVLVDSGSTHNFIHPDLAAKLGLEVEALTPFRVYIGNGESMSCNGCCPRVKLTLQEVIFEIDLFILPIQGPDMVLGIPWLQELGHVIHDYKNMTMEFTWKTKKVKLKGDSELSGRKVTFNQLQGMVKREEVQEFYELTWQHRYGGNEQDDGDRCKFTGSYYEDFAGI